MSPYTEARQLVGKDELLAAIAILEKHGIDCTREKYAVVEEIAAVTAHEKAKTEFTKTRLAHHHQVIDNAGRTLFIKTRQLPK